MGKKVFWTMLLVLAVLLWAIGPATTQAQPKVLKWASYAGSNLAYWEAESYFIKEFEKRTGGKYKVEPYFSGTLGKAPDLASFCGKGLADMIFCATGYSPSQFVLTRGFELPYITENPYAQARAIWKMYHTYKPLNDEWEKQNGLLLLWPSNMDIMATLTKVPVRKVNEMKGLRLRSYALIGKIAAAWGAQPVALAYPEIYEALQRGVIEGAMGIPYQSVLGSKHWEHAKYVIDTGVGVYSLTYTAMSLKTYKSFPPEVRKTLDELREEMVDKWAEFIAMWTERDVKILLDQGIHYIEWSPEEKALGKKMAVPMIWESWLDEAKKKGLPAEEFLAIYKTEVKAAESDPRNQYMSASQVAEKLGKK